MRSRALDVLAKLAELHQVDRDIEQATQALERAIEIDPYAEQIYRRLILLQLEDGRPDAAVRVFRRLERSLADLDVEPDPETMALMERAASAARVKNSR